MSMLDDFKLDLRKYEGVKAYPYDDATGQVIGKGNLIEGNITIGVGRDLNKNPLTDDEIEYLLSNDTRKIFADCHNNFTWFRGLTYLQERGIMNMVYQLGLEGFKQFHDLIAAMDRGDYVAAKRAGMNSAWFKQTPDRAQDVLNMVCPDAVA